MKTKSRVCWCPVLLGGLMVGGPGPLAWAQLTDPPFDGAVVRFHAADVIAPRVTLEVQSMFSVPGWFVLRGTIVEEGGSGLRAMDFQVSRGGLYLTPEGTWTSQQVFLPPNLLIINGTDWTDQLWVPVRGPQDEGTYRITVRATDGDGNSATASAEGTVGFRPSVVSLTGPQLLFEGENLTLAATVSGTLPLQVQWLRDGAAIAGTNITSLPGSPFSNAWLRLESVTTNDAGRYSMRVSNPVGTFDKDLVRVPVIADLTPDLMAWVGWSVTGRVHVADPVGNVRLQWEHNGVTLTNRTRPELALTNLTSLQSGIYTLRATNGAARVRRDIFDLSVLVLSQLEPPPATAVSGSDAFQFRVNGPNGAPLAVEATRDFRQWDMLVVVTNRGAPLIFRDPGMAGTDRRYYRVRQLGEPTQ
ncbi:MAG TPA: immunoglobulin domain-containing protein [Methylomirabilota bacterium]|nr:immunoglobulin domain-containing protein [Methylomirabilota bacterium]